MMMARARSSSSDEAEAPSLASPTSGSRWERARLVGAPRGGAPAALEPARARFPFALVWSPLPGITACAPVVGHMGICDSRGVVYDFGGPFFISVDDFSFGAPYLYLPLDPSDALGFAGDEAPRGAVTGAAAAARWDAAVDAANDDFARRMHNIVCNNCHHHAAAALNAIGYKGRRNWGQVSLAAMVILRGTWVSRRALACVWAAPLLVAVALAVLVSRGLV